MNPSPTRLAIKHLGKLLLKQDYRNTYLRLKKLQAKPRYQTTEITLPQQVFRVPDSASFVFMYREIFEHQIYRFTATRSNPRIVDCGANIGLSVLYFKNLYPEAQVIAFEPDQAIFEILSWNIQRSIDPSSIELHAKALWSSETILEFASEGADAGRLDDGKLNDGKLSQSASQPSSIIRVPTVRLRSYLEEFTDFLKLDIEGAELEVIQDCQDLLQNVQHLFIEYHSFIEQPQRLDELLKILVNAGFRYYLQPSVSSPQPLYQIHTYAGMDSQVNIFAYRSDSGVQLV